MAPVRRDTERSDAARAFAMRRPVPALLIRDHVGFTEAARTFDRWLLPPPASVTMIINIGEPFGGLPQAFVAGLDDTYSVVEPVGAVECVDVKLTPVGAYRVLGQRLDALTGRTVDLEDIAGRSGRQLVDAIRAEPSWEQRFSLVDHFLSVRAGDGPAPAPEVVHAWRRVVARYGAVSIGQIAAEVGWSHKHLITMFKQQIGLPPGTVARISRFNALLDRLARSKPPVRWTYLAECCGYYDQAHLDREFREFAGTTPTDFLTRRLAGGSIVGDGVKTVQDS